MATVFAIVWYSIMIFDWMQGRRDRHAAIVAARVVEKAAAVAADVRAKADAATALAVTKAAEIVNTASATAELVAKAAVAASHNSDADAARLLQEARVKAWADELECDLVQEMSNG